MLIAVLCANPAELEARARFRLAWPHFGEITAFDIYFPEVKAIFACRAHAPALRLPQAALKGRAWLGHQPKISLSLAQNKSA
jgi:hypothetical protein